MHLEEKTLKSETIYEGLIFNITHDTVLLENDTTTFRDVLWHNGGVCVIPVTDNNEIYLVKQFRYPFSTALREVPAGKLEKGESHEICGRRELLEETGFTCDEFIYLGEMLPTPAYNSEITHIYLAKGLKFSKQCLDEGEFLDVEKIPLSEAVELVMNGTIRDAKTQIAILKSEYILAKD